VRTDASTQGSEAANDLGRDRRARGQPGRLDPEQVHQPGDAVRLGALQHEVARRLARPLQLRAHAAVRRRQRAVGERRPVAPDRGVEERAARRVDGVVDRVGRADVEPFDVGAEARLAGEVEREVDAEAARLGTG
jgi:hypothetical protein